MGSSRGPRPKPARTTIAACVTPQYRKTALANLRHENTHTHTHFGFVQPWQNLFKLNYEANCRVFDVIKIEAPRWNAHRPEAPRATADALERHEQSPEHRATRTYSWWASLHKSASLRVRGASRSGLITPLWLRKWWLFRSGEGCWLVVTSGNGRPSEGWAHVCVLVGQTLIM